MNDAVVDRPVGGRADRAGDEPRDLGGRVSLWAIAFVSGTAAGWLGLPATFAAGLSLLAVAAVAGLAWQRQWEAASWAAVLAAGPLGAWWCGMASGPGHAALRSAVPTGESILARVTGVIEPTVRDVEPDRGAMGRFNYQPPGTAAPLRVETIQLAGEPRPVEGYLVLRLKEHDTRLRAGMRVEATGWLRAIEGPSNPGEFDYRRWLERRGVVGRLTLPSRENWRELATPWWRLGHWVGRARAAVSGACLASLREGLRDAGPARGLLEALLLGVWGDELGELPDTFRRVGLAHVLSISGAHLGILMGLVWLGARLAVPHPPRAALVVLAVLLMYVMALPLRTPIVRAAIMAGVFCVGYATGRRPSPVGLLGVAAVVVLLWRPGDVASAGFQLSFGVVAALLLWTRGVSAMLWPPPVIEPVHPTMGQRLTRMGADYAAVSLIAFGVAMPLVAWHYQLVSPLAVAMSGLALPVLTAVLGLGYLKIVAGLIAGEIGGVLAGPLRWMADTLIALVVEAEAWPGSAVELASRPSVAWVVAGLAVVVAACGGLFAGSRRGPAPAAAWRGPLSGLAAGAVVVAWLGWTTTGTPAAATWGEGRAGHGGAAAARVTMLSVGDGSCFVVEWPGAAWVFDCGSQSYFDVGARTAADALAHLGIERIDTLVVSHADLDHFNGVLDLVDAVPTRRVLTTPAVLDEAATSGGSPTAFLVSELRQRGLLPMPVEAGWRETHGGVAVTALWPTPGFEGEHPNDRSLVLAFDVSTPHGHKGVQDAAKRRLLLNGDVQDRAKPALLRRHHKGEIDLRAEVTDLPHHGAFVDASPEWLVAVSPAVILQSTGHARLRRDPWADVLGRHAAARYATPWHGATSVTITRHGAIEVETYGERE